MIDYEKLIRKARLSLDENEKKYSQILKYLKYRQDKTIYQRLETIVLWNEGGQEKETKVSILTRKAKNFKDYCENNNTTMIKEDYIF